MIKKPDALISVGGCMVHGCGIFIAPFFIGFFAAFVFGASEITDTYGVMTIVGLLMIFPAFAAQVIAVLAKVRRESDFQKRYGQLDALFLIDAFYRHSRILTARGWGALIGGIVFTCAAVLVKWASLGTTAIFLLLLFYMMLGISSFVSAFMVRSFSDSLGRGRSGIRREMSPAVVLSGEPAEERFVLTRVPIPTGFILLIEDNNPPELETESRYAAGEAAQKGIVTLMGQVRRTPRGLHRLGPAKIWFQDALGFTRVSVASAANTTLKCLPRFKPVQIQEAPTSALEMPDILTKPHRFATEDYFRFKEYTPGDDSRRIHWKLSIRSGMLQVRIPETKETTTEKILLALDCYMPSQQILNDAIGVEMILDNLVEVWISLAAKLQEEGNQVALVTVADNGDGDLEKEVCDCASSAHSQWQDLGARVRWQGQSDVDFLVDSIEEESHLIVVSSRFAPPPMTPKSRSLIWIYLPPIQALGSDEVPFWKTQVGPEEGASLRLLKALTLLPFPVGSEENTALSQFRSFSRQWTLYHARRRLRYLAKQFGDETLAKIIETSDSCYKLIPVSNGYRLIGLKTKVSL